MSVHVPWESNKTSSAARPPAPTQTAVENDAAAESLPSGLGPHAMEVSTYKAQHKNKYSMPPEGKKDTEPTPETFPSAVACAVMEHAGYPAVSAGSQAVLDAYLVKNPKAAAVLKAHLEEAKKALHTYNMAWDDVARVRYEQGFSEAPGSHESTVGTKIAKDVLQPALVKEMFRAFRADPGNASNSDQEVYQKVEAHLQGIQKKNFSMSGKYRELRSDPRYADQSDEWIYEKAEEQMNEARQRSLAQQSSGPTAEQKEKVQASEKKLQSAKGKIKLAWSKAQEAAKGLIPHDNWVAFMVRILMESMDENNKDLAFFLKKIEDFNTISRGMNEYLKKLTEYQQEIEKMADKQKSNAEQRAGLRIEGNILDFDTDELGPDGKPVIKVTHYNSTGDGGVLDQKTIEDQVKYYEQIKVEVTNKRDKSTNYYQNISQKFSELINEIFGILRSGHESSSMVIKNIG